MTKTYEKFAPEYDAVMRPLERWFLTRLRAETFELLPQNARILELGAGTGRNFVFYPAGTQGVASEPTGAMIRIAKDRERPSGVTLVQSNAEELPFQSAVFDAAFATLVFCSVSSPQKAFSELRRVVKPGGTIVLLEHVRPGGLLGLLFDLINLVTRPLFEDNFNRRTTDEARAAGLQLLRVEQRLAGIINLIACRV
jgi:phosphatidylethanolamine/phosphatidyl-N-methylethanolamine N-methyltransferase